MLKQHLEVGEKEITLTNSHNVDGVLEENYQERKDTYHDKGFTEQRTMRKVCSIPSYMFAHEPLLQEYLRNVDTDQAYARRLLKVWLDMNPEYKTNEGSI